MEQLIAAYLFQSNGCTLRGIGHLVIIPSATLTDFSNKLIFPPTPRLQLQRGEQDTDAMIRYLASSTGSTIPEADLAYEAFCKRIRNELRYKGVSEWKGVGLFKGATEYISFEAQALPWYYCQPVDARRVIHPESTHQVLVGDKATTNVAMTEYFAGKPAHSDRWWIWAIVLAVLGIAALTWYFINGHAVFPYGNEMPIHAV